MFTTIRQDSKDQLVFDSAMRALEAEIANVGMHVTIDSTARLAYMREIAKMSSELQSQVASGRITWLQAAKQAQEMRNVIMHIIRGRSTPVGRAYAEWIKLHGKTLNGLIAEKTIKLFGKDANFERLNKADKNQVYQAVVESSGGSRENVSRNMRMVGPAGRSLIIISLAVSVYTVATADNKIKAAGREVAITGAGIGGGIAGGAIAGLACGPAAPVCVTVGAFVGGALAAFGIGFLW